MLLFKELEDCLGSIIKRFQLEKIYFKKGTQESFKKIKNKNITAVDYTNEIEKVFLKA